MDPPVTQPELRGGTLVSAEKCALQSRCSPFQVGVVLADSSVVTIALPDILARYHVEISTLAWVLTRLQPCASSLHSAGRVPRTTLARARLRTWGPRVHRCFARVRPSPPRSARSLRAGLSRASRGRPWCAPRSTCSAEVHGTDMRAARIWTLAGIVGAALGPAVGGILTQLLGWESIFFVQAPVVLLALPRVARRASRARSRAGRTTPRRPRTRRCCSSRAGSWPRCFCS